MDLYDVMRTTPAVRDYLRDPVPDEVVYRILDNARFAVNGSNHQPWRVIVVQDRTQRELLRDHYVLGFRESWAYIDEGLRPFAPQYAGTGAPITREAAHEKEHPDAFADAFDEVPVLLLVLVELGVLSVTDNHLDRQSFVGGGSVYPFVQNILLGARNEGLGSLLATLVVRQEEELRPIFAIPDTHAIAAVVAIGTPRKVITKLSRHPVEEFARIDRFDGPPLAP